ncbi:MAG TPA: 16S rRNA (guanine(527)-N(7))-methyltransferase RsmG [Bryocella sp.]|nr:16S rRNA (guanine(527)-N(7))-methyltransferase RsmG [Bryocella sp.]
MPALSPDRIRSLLAPFILPPLELPEPLIDQVSDYLELLLRWNARVSLTAIRSPEEIAQRHFGESFFAAGHLATRLPPNAELLDYGSGPGFPGLPIQMLFPGIHVTLAESQARKVAFLREVIRTLHLSAEVWPRRVEEMPESRRFDAVTMRAVEKMTTAMDAAAGRVREGGWIATLVGREIDATDGEEFRIPTSEHRRLVIRQIVPRGTIL